MEDPKNTPPTTPFESNQGPKTPFSWNNIRILVLIAYIAAPVSLFYGGVLLSGIGLICAIIALRRVSNAMKRDPEHADSIRRFKSSAWVAIFVTGLAFAFNMVAVAIVLPVVLEAVQTGDLSTLEQLYGQDLSSLSGSTTGSEGSSSKPGSVWG